MTSLVSTDEVIARVKQAATLDTVALQGIIDANEILLRNRTSVRADDDVSITVPGRNTVILLPYRFDTISEVKEHWFFVDPSDDLVLDPTDWRMAPDGTAIERLHDGPNPTDGFFSDEVIVSGTAQTQTALLKNILIQLCAVDINGTANAGLRRQRLGDYEEEKDVSAQNGVAQQKDNILGQLASPLPVFS